MVTWALWDPDYVEWWRPAQLKQASPLELNLGFSSAHHSFPDVVKSTVTEHSFRCTRHRSKRADTKQIKDSC